MSGDLLVTTGLPPNSHASAAPSPAISTDKHVLVRHRMTCTAGPRASDDLPWGHPPRHVLGVCNGFKMARVPAGAVPAQMIQLHAGRYRADVVFKRHPMGSHMPSPALVGERVPVGVQSIRGFPAFGGPPAIHDDSTRVQSLYRCGPSVRAQRVSVLLPSLVVLGAPTTADRAALASLHRTAGTLHDVDPPHRVSRGRGRCNVARPVHFSVEVGA